MKKHITVSHQEVCELICDGCGLQAYADNNFEFSEFMSISHQCGYGSIHGDGNQITMDICQHCFAGMCGDVLTVTDPVDNQSTDAPEESLEYNNIFQATTQSKQKANELKQESDIRTSARDTLPINTISSQEELQIALKRVEQLWHAQYHSAEGNELHKLAGLICAYENKSWDSYFAQVPLIDDHFMPERVNFKVKIPFEEAGVASGMLADMPVNKQLLIQNEAIIFSELTLKPTTRENHHPY